MLPDAVPDVRGLRAVVGGRDRGRARRPCEGPFEARHWAAFVWEGGVGGGGRFEDPDVEVFGAGGGEDEGGGGFGGVGAFLGGVR